METVLNNVYHDGKVPLKPSRTINGGSRYFILVEAVQSIHGGKKQTRDDTDLTDGIPNASAPFRILYRARNFHVTEQANRRIFVARLTSVQHVARIKRACCTTAAIVASPTNDCIARQRTKGRSRIAASFQATDGKKVTRFESLTRL